MRNPTSPSQGPDLPAAAEYDVVVIGAGPTGENVADRVVKAGLSAVIVEGELVGGECSYFACVPSKALLRPAAAVAEAHAVAGAREAVTGPLDVPAVLGRRDAFVSGLRDDGQVQWLKSAGIDLVRGWGRLAGERRVAVRTDSGEAALTARHAVVLCTGSSAVMPPVPGLADVGAWTSREATTADAAPRRLVVLGGGVVGCEMAAAWSALGSRVTMLVRGEGLLPSWEPFAAARVADGLRGEGVEIRTGVEAERVARDHPSGVVTTYLSDGSTVESEEFLVATGRSPRTGGLGLETVGLEPGGRLLVDDSCRVTELAAGWLYAAGDINQRSPLTHMGKYQARACATAIAARAAGRRANPTPWTAGAATADHRAVPQVVFTRPEAAAVGLTEEQARRAGLPVRVVEYPIGDVAGASLLADGYRGHAKLVVDEQRSIVVGCTLVGPGVGELIHAATVAIVGEVPLERLWHAVPAFPTVSEIWLRLLERYGL
ncbi:pyruvate/2-oxoglutarate dehydrogenase complex dihydrolipoamide dehydrogenase (E3) component [Kitasatospora sp. GP30]|uniref:dihydrolipoyl dehydrogenase family protein n=1 Tax=Kitasatospora sp. GP30 TaxID=3035084 RepID=UPI000C711AC1|nr:NAD(P)/FAD-dependent oxidoreductase [Kitasatospora sp. GP30]MDH6145851.1 pyruvate/2-oxoglutarate dehydrogenase complex dihydrolipoamide dehydrogenase (E3) component [Kitasatospora sp. GP30]